MTHKYESRVIYNIPLGFVSGSHHIVNRVAEDRYGSKFGWNRDNKDVESWLRALFNSGVNDPYGWEEDWTDVCFRYLKLNPNTTVENQTEVFRDNHNCREDEAREFEALIKRKINFLKCAAKDNPEVMNIINKMSVEVETKVNDVVILTYCASGSACHYGHNVESEHRMEVAVLRSDFNKEKYKKKYGCLTQRRSSCSEFKLTLVDGMRIEEIVEDTNDS